MQTEYQAIASSLRVQADKGYQESALPGVSRSFAFTIPQLPELLRTAVSNAYLLCRVADTLEDHGLPGTTENQALFRQLITAIESGAEDSGLGERILRRLSEQTPVAERELVRNLARVLRVTAALPADQRAAIRRCVATLGSGMAAFEALKSPVGLANLSQFDQYCYYVAGVVGEMLTALFCDYSPVMARRRQQMMPLALAFGQGLQMTNILKDVWDDRARGICWLPRDVFARHGCALEADADWAADPAFWAGLREMVARAHGHLALARDYTLLIPANEPGIRRFCGWAIGMALLTLRQICRQGIQAQHPAKVSRPQVARIIAVSNFAIRHDWALRGCFRLASLGLPAAIPPATLSPPPAQASAAGGGATLSS